MSKALEASDYLWRLKGLVVLPPMQGVAITRGPLLTVVAVLVFNPTILTPNSHA